MSGIQALSVGLYWKMTSCSSMVAPCSGRAQAAPRKPHLLKGHLTPLDRQHDCSPSNGGCFACCGGGTKNSTKLRVRNTEANSRPPGSRVHRLSTTGDLWWFCPGAPEESPSHQPSTRTRPHFILQTADLWIPSNWQAMAPTKWRIAAWRPWAWHHQMAS